jgi:hypothetical protein
MRLSSWKGALAVLSSAAGQEIRVPGWAHVWRAALRASLHGDFAVSFSSQLATGEPVAPK